MHAPTVMILAAGRGKRMGSLTDHCPKPLLQIADKAIIEYHLNALQQQGFSNIVINTAYLGEKLPETLGNGEAYGLNIQYSHEQKLGLETAGGIIHALPLLGTEPFIVINGDVWTDYPFSQLRLPSKSLAHLVLVDNPEHNPKGDFSMQSGLLKPCNEAGFTFSGIGIYSPSLFKSLTPGFRPLKEPLLNAMSSNTISGELYHGIWADIGTPERLIEITNTLHP